MLGKFITKNGLDSLKKICPSLKIVIPTSELLLEEDRNSLQLAFGVPCYQEYGASEFGMIAMENLNKNFSICSEFLYVEIINDNNDYETVNPGRVLITDLFNKAMPFIRYDIGDIGLIRNESTLKGYESLCFDKLEGRTNDTIYLPSGKKSPGLTFYYVSRSILESSGIIKEFVIKQVKIDTFLFEIVSDRDLDKDEIISIKKKMDIYLEPGLNLKINRVNSIKREKSGKIKHFFSELA